MTYVQIWRIVTSEARGRVVLFGDCGARHVATMRHWRPYSDDSRPRVIGSDIIISINDQNIYYASTG